jgi:hypothetical protein
MSRLDQVRPFGSGAMQVEQICRPTRSIGPLHLETHVLQDAAKDDAPLWKRVRVADAAAIRI